MAVIFKKSIEAEVTNTSIKKFQGTKDSKDIVCLVSDEHTWDLQTHYIDGYGSFHCFRGQCCIDYPKVNISYVYPMIKYTMTGQGLDYTKPTEFMFLKAGKDLYSQIKMFEETGGKLPETDFLFHCTDAQYQKIKIAEIKNKQGAKWRHDRELVQQVKDFIKSYELLIETAVKVKPMDAQKYENLYDSPEFIKSQEKFGNNNLGTGTSNNTNYLTATTAPRQLSSPKTSVIVDESEFDSLLDV